MALAASERVEEMHEEANTLAIKIMDRAKQACGLRDDFVGEDLPLVLLAHAAIFRVTRLDAPAASSRLVAFFLPAVAARQTATPLPDPPTSEQMRSRDDPFGHGSRCAAGSQTPPGGFPTPGAARLTGSDLSGGTRTTKTSA